MNEKKFRYNRADFRPLPVKLEHLDIHLNFLEKRVEGRITLWMTARQALDRVRLDARDLDIHAVVQAARPGGALRYDYRREENVLVVHLPERVEAGASVAVEIAASCEPSENVLEGIYRDTPPPGCPPQYMSQCQQWGFQRILPVLDDCTAKCTMVTTLEADARYTHLVSNGNVRRSANPDGRPVKKPGDPSRQVITYENFIPMAPYLFIAAVGTWDVLEDEVVYPSGRRVKLEYLVPPGRKAGAAAPMKILKESVLWQGRTQSYEYIRDVYRTICMEKSNFGGMENVGNTTIVTDAALMDAFTGDARVLYAYGVIVHEFEHNQCGSDVTMETPFDMWLNEAFTVDVERQFLRDCFDPDGRRLEEVDSMRAPIGGPLAIEDAGHMGNIVREGFNDPDELVDGVTYVKAAEVIRMLRLVLGADTFRKAKDLYFSRHTGGNANTDQFFACFEETSGRDLGQFKREWLYTIGYPKVEASWHYDRAAAAIRVSLTQDRAGKGGLFHIPMELAAVDREGRDIPSTATIVELREQAMSLELKADREPVFVSFNRGCSFYGTFRDRTSTPERLALQARKDADRFNRVEAMRRLTDIERIKLVGSLKAGISDLWLETIAGLLRDTSLPPGLKAYLLRVDEQSLDRDYLPFYRERYAARIRLLQAIAERFPADLLAAYHAVDSYAPAREPKDGIEERMLKAILLRTLVEARTPEVYRLAEDHFRQAWNITDKLSALSCINVSEHPRRREVLEEGYRRWKDHLSAYSSYLGVVSSGTHDDVFDMIAAEETRPEFKVEHPTHSRALYLPMTGNNKMLWTEQGIQWVTDKVIRMAAINENTAIRLASCFQQVARLADDLKPRVVAALRSMRDGVDSAHAPSVAGRIKAFLDSVK